MREPSAGQKQVFLAVTGLIAVMLVVGIVTFRDGRSPALTVATPSCDHHVAAQLFGAGGYAPRVLTGPVRGMAGLDAAKRSRGRQDPIYSRWLSLYCRAIYLGPATSKAQLQSGVWHQDFARTAHRIKWRVHGNRVAVVPKRAVAAKVFAKNGITPQWDLPVPRAWLAAYYAGNDYGPALDPVRLGKSAAWQQQVFGARVGTFANSVVTWSKAVTSPTGSKLYSPQLWQPIAHAALSFGQAVTLQQAQTAAQYLAPGLANTVISECPQVLLGFDGWPEHVHDALRTWNSGTADVKAVFRLGTARVAERFAVSNQHPWKIIAIHTIRGGISDPSCPPWTPPANAFPGTYSVGDSVMVDAQPDLQIMGITVDAAVDRQFDTGIAILRQLKADGQLPPRVVIGLGTNGPMTQSDYESALQMLSGEARVVILTVREPRWWQDQVNQVVHTVAKEFKNVRTADWYTASAGHADFFAGDGVHLQPSGALAFSHVIANALASP